MSKAAATPITWAVAERPFQGETVSGDAAVIESWSGGALVAVIDALGHGPEAEQAARIAGDVLRARPADPPLALVQQCHEALRRTRGAAMTVASITTQDDSLTWTGIGNVEAVLFRANRAARPERDSAILRGGIVGGQLPALRATRVQLAPGDTLILATDGIGSRFTTITDLSQAPQDLADRIHREFAKGTDDSLVVVVRYRGDAR